MTRFQKDGTSTGDHSGSADPMRRCVFSRKVLPKADLLRFAADTEGRLWPDLYGRLEGRGVWLRATSEILAGAARKSAFSHGFRLGMGDPSSLVEDVEDLMRTQVLNTLSLARKAGDLVGGREKVIQWVRDGRAKVCLHAHGVSLASKQKIASASPVGMPVGQIVMRAIGDQEIGARLGREFCVHLALQRGRLGERCVEYVRRWNAFSQPEE